MHVPVRSAAHANDPAIPNEPVFHRVRPVLLSQPHPVMGILKVTGKLTGIKKTGGGEIDKEIQGFHVIWSVVKDREKNGSLPVCKRGNTGYTQSVHHENLARIRFIQSLVQTGRYEKALEIRTAKRAGGCFHARKVDLMKELSRQRIDPQKRRKSTSARVSACSIFAILKSS